MSTNSKPIGQQFSSSIISEFKESQLQRSFKEDEHSMLEATIKTSKSGQERNSGVDLPFKNSSLKKSEPKPAKLQSKSSDDSSSESESAHKEKSRPENFREENQRFIKIGQPKPLYGLNAVRGTEGSTLAFLPRVLFEQFIDPANVLFLTLSILQCVPEVSLTAQSPTLLISLLFVLLVTIIKEACESASRNALDSEENSSKANLFKQDRSFAVAKDSLCPGNIVLIKEGEKVPADCLLLYSSSVHREICFIDTRNIDGSCTLRRKRIVLPRENSDKSHALEYLKLFANALVVYDKDNRHPDYFNGTLELEERKVALSIENVLMKGSTLKNTDHVYCVVLFTG